MKRIVSFICFLIITGSFSKTFSYDSTAARYMPLQIGNVWLYIENGGYPYNGCYTYHRYAITGTSQINGKTYYQFSFSTRGFGNNCIYPNNISRLYSNMQIRLDSLSGNIYIDENCGTFGRVLIDSLKARLGDSAYICGGGNSERSEFCSDTSLINIFGMNKSRKSFSMPHASGSETQSYAADIGMYYSGWGESSYWWTETLLGCVINGVVYGDTSTLVGINKISSEVPDKFSLSQNYPNPFNPATNIKFTVPQKSFVTIAIYNVLGEEVTRLLNENLSTGTYETSWDAGNYPSGVYYYKLGAGNFTETKKMVLIK